MSWHQVSLRHKAAELFTSVNKRFAFYFYFSTVCKAPILALVRWSPLLLPLISVETMNGGYLSAIFSHHLWFNCSQWDCFLLQVENVTSSWAWHLTSTVVDVVSGGGTTFGYHPCPWHHWWHRQWASHVAIPALSIVLFLTFLDTNQLQRFHYNVISNVRSNHCCCTLLHKISAYYMNCNALLQIQCSTQNHGLDKIIQQITFSYHIYAHLNWFLKWEERVAMCAGSPRFVYILDMLHGVHLAH